MAEPLHNEFPPGSLEARDLEHLLHPTTNLKLHHEKGPAVHARAKGVYLWDNQGRQYLEGMGGPVVHGAWLWRGRARRSGDAAD